MNSGLRITAHAALFAIATIELCLGLVVLVGLQHIPAATGMAFALWIISATTLLLNLTWINEAQASSGAAAAGDLDRSDVEQPRGWLIGSSSRECRR